MNPPERRAVEAFRARFRRKPEVVVLAPGRVNLIGEHTDYSGGFVFPAAIDRYVAVAAARSARPRSRLVSLERPGHGVLSLGEASPGCGGRNWWNYPAGMAWALREATGEPVPEIEAVVQSSVPIGAGVSSSAAIEMAFGVAWNELCGLGLSGSELARLGQRCENGYIGVQSGVMDQLASALGREGRAMFIDTRSLAVEYAPLPAGTTLVLCDTKRPRSLAGSSYNARRAECEAAAAALGVPQLRDASLEDLRRTRLEPTLERRARHVISENARCIAFKSALETDDLTAIGRLMHASHASLRDDFEVSCPELDAMAAAAEAAPGCLGARMTGAGFGGACVAIVLAASARAFESATLAEYERRTGVSGETLVCSPAAGARRLEVEI